MKAGLLLFLALAVLDGAIRKWLLPEFEQLVYVAKDALLVALVLWYFSNRSVRLPAGLAGTAFGGWLALYAGIVVLQAFNPSLPSVLLGLFGIKAHILYASLVVLVPAAFRDVDDLARTLRSLLLPVMVVLCLGVVQFYFPVDHPLNRYARGSVHDIATFGLVGKVRVTSTFSYVSGMTVFVFFALCLSAALLAAGRWRMRENKLASACLLAALVVTPMTGARWIFYMIVLCLPVFLYGMIRTSMLETRYAWRLIVLSSVATAAISFWSLEALESLEYRRQSTGDAPTRVQGLLLDPITFGAEAGLLGYGTGATHQAAPALLKDPGDYPWLPIRTFEDEPGRVMLELGILGFLSAFALRAYLCVLAWSAAIKGGSRNEKALGAAALVFFVAHLVSPIVFNVTGSAFYWFFAGVVATILRDQNLRRVTAPVSAPATLRAFPMRPLR